MSIRLGIIGLSADEASWATRAHTVALKAPVLSQQYSIVALCTSSTESARAAARFYEIPEEKAYHSAEAIADDPNVDMVVVSVKVPLHKQLTIPALNAKKDVFVEWPLGNGLAEAEELAALAKKQNVRTAVGLQARLSPTVQKAKEIIDSGALGRIIDTTLSASTSSTHILPIRASYFNDPKSGANPIANRTAQGLDPICFMLGEFKSLNATTAISFPTVQFVYPDGKKTDPVKRNFVDSVSVQGILESGTTVNYVLNTTTDQSLEHLNWIISGEKGSLKFEGSSPFLVISPPILSQYISGEGAGWEEIEVGSGTFGGIGDVYAAFADNRKGFVDFDEAVKRHKMVEAIYRSAEKGTRESY